MNDSIDMDRGQIKMIIEEGLDFITSHFEPKTVWPRPVFTSKTKQVLVYNREEALAIYKRAGLLDCRINAFPDYTGFGGMNRQAPNFIFIDLDLAHFGSREALDRALRKVLKNIDEKFRGAYPTVIWSGNGYHIYLPIRAFVLESESIFAEFEQPSKKFPGFAERFLTNNKSDPCHNLTFKSCLLRVPGTHNAKCVEKNNGRLDSTTEVKVTQKWNDNRPAINLILRDFRRYLIQERIDNNVAERKRSQFLSKVKKTDWYSDSTTRRTSWIEILLDTPIEDYRKEAIRQIIAPYLINIRKLPYDDAYTIAKNWLNNCSEIKPLDFDGDARIKYALKAAARVGYIHMGFRDLKSENAELYNHISEELRFENQNKK